MSDETDSAPLLDEGDVPPDLLAALDRARALAPDNPARSEMIRRILSQWLTAKGHLRRAGADEGTRPEDLTSQNDD